MVYLVKLCIGKDPLSEFTSNGQMAGNLVGIIVRSAESGNVFHVIFEYRLLLMSAQFKNMSKSYLYCSFPAPLKNVKLILNHHSVSIPHEKVRKSMIL